MYDEDEYLDPLSPEDYGYIHEDQIPDLDFCQKMLHGALECVYHSGDISKLEDCLEELCAQFKMKMTPRKPVIESTQSVKKLQWETA